MYELGMTFYVTGALCSCGHEDGDHVSAIGFCHGCRDIHPSSTERFRFDDDVRSQTTAGIRRRCSGFVAVEDPPRCSADSMVNPDRVTGGGPKKKSASNVDHELCKKFQKEAEDEAQTLANSLREAHNELLTSDIAITDLKRQLEEGARLLEREKQEHRATVKDLEERLKYERSRAAQALTVAEDAASAAGSIGSLVRQLVNEDVMAQLRAANVERPGRIR